MVQSSREEIRTFALSLPEARESSHMGRRDVRVRDRIFLTLPQDGRTVNLKTTPIALDMLIRSDPTAFEDVWAGRWVAVALPRIDRGEVRDLVLEAYCLAAPKRLAVLARALVAKGRASPTSGGS